MNIFAPVLVVDLDEARSTGTAAVAINDPACITPSRVGLSVSRRDRAGGAGLSCCAFGSAVTKDFACVGAGVKDFQQNRRKRKTGLGYACVDGAVMSPEYIIVSSQTTGLTAAENSQTGQRHHDSHYTVTAELL